MRTAALVLLVAVAACTKSATVVCGDFTCPADYVCSPDGKACTTQPQIDACVDHNEVAACMAPENRPGACRGGYCQEVRCGDERADPGEMCDDGNTLSFDGCSADCSSNETCGNGVIDKGLESCDDDNTEPNDGCDATCTDESPIWRELAGLDFLPRMNHSMVYDSVRERIVMFGGQVNNGALSLSNETWEFDGDVWIRRMPANSPSPREHFGLAYDPARQRTVLFGGFDGTSELDDTWEWNGVDWTRILPAAKPSARRLTHMAYHPSRGIVLHAGVSNGTTLVDTWEYNGTTWTQGPNGLTPAGGAGFAYDSGIGAIVTFSAVGSTLTYNGTWSTLITPVAGVRGRSAESFVFDPYAGTSGRISMIGGGEYACGAGKHCGDAYEMIGTGTTSRSWSSISVPYLPRQAAAAYHVATHQLVIMGGVTPGNQTPESATWIKRINTWRRLATPPARVECHMAYVPNLGTVLVGGAEKEGTATLLGDTWVLRMNRWERLRTNTDPPAVRNSAMAFDRTRGKLVLFDNVNAETWELSDGQWAKVTTANAPPPRTATRMVHDEKRNAIVLFGGEDAGMPVSDVWTYDGVNWTPLTTTGTPTARSDFSMTYNTATGTIIVFGGLLIGGAYDATTWELSGTTWTQIQGTGPSARAGATLTYDPVRKSSILYSGRTGATSLVNDTWEYANGEWTKITTVSPQARVHACAAYDETMRRTIVVGGTPQTEGLGETWMFGYE